MKIGVVTLFPEMFAAVTDYGITSRACREGIVSLQCWNPRDFTQDKHRTVDDRPFGGGPGMLMKTEPLRGAIVAAKEALAGAGEQPKVIYLSPQGRKLDQAGVEALASCQSMVLVCGRYQGIDERLLESDIDEEWSIGDFVLSGGELGAMVLVDAITRYQPNALGHEDSAKEDSFADGLLDCPQYTRPQEYEGKSVPDVLLGGNHEEIRKWRLKHSLGNTWLKRPDLLDEMALDTEQKGLLEQFIGEYEAKR
ncbi:MAG: tRNA (guanosine(37)-N1)-methyltransferase TrmD [Pseudohongiellaceae bacterium]|nr:tRNA (guanosine(37)-N1)-methyltransferase TrmD [Pseudohongiellaceae bacterium]